MNPATRQRTGRDHVVASADLAPTGRDIMLYVDARKERASVAAISREGASS